MFRSILIVIAISVFQLVQAQSDEEALRYSMHDNLGTARYVGAGGAFNALGADFSTLSTNPAGLGVYRHSEFTGSMGIYANDFDARYFGDGTNSGNGFLYFPNFGLVFSNENETASGRKKVDGFIRTNFGIGINRISNYRQDLTYEGINPNNSLMHQFVEDLNEAGGTNPSDVYDQFPYGAGLAYETFMIDPLMSDTTNYISNIPYGGALQNMDLERRGRMNEWVFSLGGSYNDKLYLGATVGIPTLNYSEEKVFTEEDVNDTISNFRNYSYTQTLNTDASGVNLKLGMIYWITNKIRIGAALHTPTYLKFNDQYVAGMESELDTVSYRYEANEGNFSYAVITPWRAMASAAFVLGKYGFISAEYEYYNPGSARFWFNEGGSQSFENTLNEDISSKYGGVNIVRVGAELALEQFRLRGGINYSSTVFKETVIPDEAGDYQQFGYSFGAGFMSKWFFADVAFQTTQTDFANVPYTLDDPNQTVGGALIDWSKYNFVATAGIKF